MKNIYYIVLALLLSACTGDFLEIYPETSLNEGVYYKTESEYIMLANGCYVPMRDYEKTNHWVITEVKSDNGSYQYNPTDGGDAGRGTILQFLVSASSGIYTYFWDASYNGIYRCNKLLSEIDRPEVSWSKASLKERCSGEAYFLRALYYFNLVRQFGGVPIILEPLSSKEAFKIKRSTVDQVYALIIDDLNMASTHFKLAQDVEEPGRANLGTTNAILGKVYLTLRKYAESEKALKIVIESGKYDLLPNYADLFNPTKKDFKETIFSIQYGESSVELSNQFIFIFAPWTSGGDVTKRPNIKQNSGQNGWNQPTDDLIGAFEADDLRKNVSIGYWTGKDWDGVVRAIPYCAKFKPPVAAPDNRCSDNLPVIRYSDVLLMYAEVLNEQGRTTEAITYVELVRKRAGLANPLVGYDKTSLATLIAKERQVEFCFENQRWYDLLRTNKALEVMTAHGIREKAKKPFLFANSYQMDPYKLLAPIPAEEIKVNGLEQNPGY